MPQYYSQYQQVLVTDNEDNGYFSITINQYNNVDSITCLSSKVRVCLTGCVTVNIILTV